MPTPRQPSPSWLPPKPVLHSFLQLAQRSLPLILQLRLSFYRSFVRQKPPFIEVYTPQNLPFIELIFYKYATTQPITCSSADNHNFASNSMRINPLFWSSGVSQNIVAKQKASAELVEAFEWVEMDSNHRSYKAADLQSAPFGHSGIYPRAVKAMQR